MKLRRLGVLLAWLLVLAVPLQGFASVSAALCMTQGNVPAMAHHDSPGDAHSHAGHDQDHPGPTGHACPACVACCAGAAISYFIAADVPAQRWVRTVATPAPFDPGVAPVRLDRPPQ
jgi:hypothetical protein